MAVPGPRGRSVIHWFNPPRRGIIPLDAFHIPASLRQRVRSARFRVTSSAFEEVIRACAAAIPGFPDRRDTWIDERIIAAYTALHRAGHARSIEAWRPGPDGRPLLVGGLYGVHIGGLFAGESMFSRPDLGGTDASKVCLVHLVAHLRRQGFTLLDTQFATPHLARFGGTEIPRAGYLAQLAAAARAEVPWGTFDPANTNT
jgi:leucyl/phenylalanyl-tRNA---protein transferase